MEFNKNECLICEEEKKDLKETNVSLNLNRNNQTMDLKFTAMICEKCAEEAQRDVTDIVKDAAAEGVPMTLEVNSGA